MYHVPCTVYCVPCTNTPCTSDLATKCYYDVHLVPRLKRGGEQSLHNNRHCPRHMRFLAIVATQETLSARSLQRVLARISKFAQIEKSWGRGAVITGRCCTTTDIVRRAQLLRFCPPRAIVVTRFLAIVETQQALSARRFLARVLRCNMYCHCCD